MAAIARWHDSAGYTILLVCFGVLFWIALYLRPGGPAVARSLAVPPPTLLPAGFTCCLGAWMLFTGAGTELWFRSATHHPAAWWRVEWPTQAPQFAEVPLTEVTAAMQADEAHAARWRSTGNRSYIMYFFRWLPGPASSRMLARFHRPEICLAAVGTKLVQEFAPETFQSGELALTFRSYLFAQNGKPLHVFFCVWEDEKADAADTRPAESWTPRTRLDAVLQKRRKLGQQVLEIGLSGEGTDDQMRVEFRRTILPLIQPDPSLPGPGSR